MLLAYTGSGKGKTTAGLGLLLRAWGHGMRVLAAFLMKTPYYMGEEVGEYKALRRLGVETLWLSDFHSPRAVLEEALARSEDYDLILLDEFNYAVRQGFLDPSGVKRLLGLKPHVVITGNYDYPELQLADLVSEVVARKHYFERGVVGVRGLEW